MSQEKTTIPNFGKEPDIEINGRPLTTAQAMTVRVALGIFGGALAEEDLGADEHGKEMTRLYQLRLREIYDIIFGGSR